MIENKIIKVEPVEDFVHINWMIGSKCNYECMYCDPEWNDKTSLSPDLDQLKFAWESIYNKTKHNKRPYYIGLAGGEPTAMKSFLPFLEYLKSFNEITKIAVSTNGSASERYYSELAELVTDLSFSTHSEFFNEANFFHKVKEIDKIMIRPKKSLHVNIMDEWWNKDRIELYKQWLDENKISYSINRINYSYSPKTIPNILGVKNIELLRKS